ncbi:MAG TPA: hypothetical protein ENK52_01040 [Saprospiraceae bacterium]|nr:hypothetical protein [Saprospiraceae bacterium]
MENITTSEFQELLNSNWRQAPQLPENCVFTVVDNAGYILDLEKGRLYKIPKYEYRVKEILVAEAEMDLAASEFRVRFDFYFDKIESPGYVIHF